MNYDTNTINKINNFLELYKKTEILNLSIVLTNNSEYYRDLYFDYLFKQFPNNNLYKLNNDKLNICYNSKYILVKCTNIKIDEFKEVIQDFILCKLTNDRLYFFSNINNFNTSIINYINKYIVNYICSTDRITKINGYYINIPNLSNKSILDKEKIYDNIVIKIFTKPYNLIEIFEFVNKFNKYHYDYSFFINRTMCYLLNTKLYIEKHNLIRICTDHEYLIKQTREKSILLNKFIIEVMRFLRINSVSQDNKYITDACMYG